MKLRVITLILLFVFSFFVIEAQNLNVQKQKLAEGYEANGDFQNASRLFIELWQSDKKSGTYFDGVQRTMIAMGKYSELLTIANERYQTSPSSQLAILIGELNWRTGKNVEASNNWEAAIKMAETNESNYLALSNTLNNLQLYDKAAATLERGRKAIGNDNLYIDELSRLYIAIGDIKRGLPEIIRFLDQRKNLAAAQGRLYALIGSDSKNKIVRDYLKNLSETNDRNLFYQELYAWFLRTTGELEFALEVYIRIDELKKSNGWEILNFANSSREDGQFEIAFKAYELIIDKGKKNPFLNQALYGYTQTLEAKYNTGAKLELSKAQEIIKRYSNIADENPKTNIAADALYRIGQIYYSQLNNLTEAKNAFTVITKDYANQAIAADALNILGEIAFEEDNTSLAKETFQKVIKSYIKTNQNASDYATLKLADIEYYNANFDSSMTLYNQLSQNSNTNIANDALDKLLLLNKLAQIPENVAKAFVNAEKSEIRNLDSIAEFEYTNCSKMPNSDDIADLALLRAGDLNIKMQKYQKAIELFNQLINMYSKSIYADVATYKIGESYEKLNDKSQAIEAFTKILVNFPNSVLLQNARDKIRALRGEI